MSENGKSEPLSQQLLEADAASVTGADLHGWAARAKALETAFEELQRAYGKVLLQRDGLVARKQDE